MAALNDLSGSDIKSMSLAEEARENSLEMFAQRTHFGAFPLALDDIMKSLFF